MENSNRKIPPALIKIRYANRHGYDFLCLNWMNYFNKSIVQNMDPKNNPRNSSREKNIA